MTNSAENSARVNPPVPRHVVLDTKSILRQFRLSGILSEPDTNELLTQVFDELMDAVDHQEFSPNNGSVYAHRPNFQMLRNKNLVKDNRLTQAGNDVEKTYTELYENLERCVYQEMREVVKADKGFHYRFRVLRGDCVMLTHLSNLEERPY